MLRRPPSSPLFPYTTLFRSRLRKGSTNSARGAAKLVTEALATVRRAGAGSGRAATVLVRADSAYYGHAIIAACQRAGARFSITARLTPAVVKPITSIDERSWVAIRYPNAIWDEDEQRWVSDAEVAETVLTAFTGRRRRDRVTARLIVRRVRRLNPATVAAGQTEAFAVYRYHAVFTDSAEPMLAAEATHRDHAIVEQVIAELKNGPLAHLPSGMFTANAAWLACATIAFNLTRAAAVLAGGGHTRSRTATVRAQLIHTPARLAHSAHQQLLHLPRDWPWRSGSMNCSAVPCTTPSPRPSDHRPRGRPEINRGRAGQTGGSAMPAHHRTHTKDQQRASLEINGGSRLSWNSPADGT